MDYRHLIAILPSISFHPKAPLAVIAPNYVLGDGDLSTLRRVALLWKHKFIVWGSFEPNNLTRIPSNRATLNSLAGVPIMLNTEQMGPDHSYLRINRIYVMHSYRGLPLKMQLVQNAATRMLSPQFLQIRWLHSWKMCTGCSACCLLDQIQISIVNL